MLIFILLFQILSADEILGCGGYVRLSNELSNVDKASLEFTTISVTIFNSGGLKIFTNTLALQRSAGYFFLPTTEQGDFTVRVIDSRGIFSFTPSEVNVTITNGKCNEEKDIIFLISGFKVSGSVIDPRTSTPLKNVLIFCSRADNTQQTAPLIAKTNELGFAFEKLVPGKYVFEARQEGVEFSPDTVIKDIGPGSDFTFPGLFRAEKFILEGKISSKIGFISSLRLSLYPIDGEIVVAAREGTLTDNQVSNIVYNEEPLRTVDVESDLQFSFGFVPSGSYLIIPEPVDLKKNPTSIPYSLQPSHIFVQVNNQQVTLNNQDPNSLSVTGVLKQFHVTNPIGDLLPGVVFTPAEDKLGNTSEINQLQSNKNKKPNKKSEKNAEKLKEQEKEKQKERDLERIRLTRISDDRGLVSFECKAGDEMKEYIPNKDGYQFSKFYPCQNERVVTSSEGSKTIQTFSATSVSVSGQVKVPILGSSAKQGRNFQRYVEIKQIEYPEKEINKKKPHAFNKLNQSITITTNITDGTFTTFLPPGRFIVSPQLSKDEEEIGIKFANSEIEFEVGGIPIDGKDENEQESSTEQKEKEIDIISTKKDIQKMKIVFEQASFIIKGTVSLLADGLADDIKTLTKIFITLKQKSKQSFPSSQSLTDRIEKAPLTFKENKIREKDGVLFRIFEYVFKTDKAKDVELSIIGNWIIWEQDKLNLQLSELQKIENKENFEKINETIFIFTTIPFIQQGYKAKIEANTAVKTISLKYVKSHNLEETINNKQELGEIINPNKIDGTSFHFSLPALGWYKLSINEDDQQKKGTKNQSIIFKDLPQYIHTDNMTNQTQQQQQQQESKPLIISHTSLLTFTLPQPLYLVEGQVRVTKLKQNDWIPFPENIKLEYQISNQLTLQQQNQSQIKQVSTQKGKEKQKKEENLNENNKKIINAYKIEKGQFGNNKNLDNSNIILEQLYQYSFYADGTDTIHITLKTRQDYANVISSDFIEPNSDVSHKQLENKEQLPLLKFIGKQQITLSVSEYLKQRFEESKKKDKQDYREDEALIQLGYFKGELAGLLEGRVDAHVEDVKVCLTLSDQIIESNISSSKQQQSNAKQPNTKQSNNDEKDKDKIDTQSFCTQTNKEGYFSFYPIWGKEEEDLIEFGYSHLTLNKEGYEIKQKIKKEEKDGLEQEKIGLIYEAKKLTYLRITVVDEYHHTKLLEQKYYKSNTSSSQSDAIPNLLVSVSTESGFRSNKKTDSAGRALFYNLPEGDIFVQPITNDYDCDPLGVMVTLKAASDDAEIDEQKELDFVEEDKNKKKKNIPQGKEKQENGQPGADFMIKCKQTRFSAFGRIEVVSALFETGSQSRLKIGSLSKQPPQQNFRQLSGLKHLPQISVSDGETKKLISIIQIQPDGTFIVPGLIPSQNVILTPGFALATSVQGNIGAEDLGSGSDKELPSFSFVPSQITFQMPEYGDLVGYEQSGTSKKSKDKEKKAKGKGLLNFLCLPALTTGELSGSVEIDISSIVSQQSSSSPSSGLRQTGSKNRKRKSAYNILNSGSMAKNIEKKDTVDLFRQLADAQLQFELTPSQLDSSVNIGSDSSNSQNLNTPITFTRPLSYKPPPFFITDIPTGSYVLSVKCPNRNGLKCISAPVSLTFAPSTAQVALGQSNPESVSLFQHVALRINVVQSKTASSVTDAATAQSLFTSTSSFASSNKANSSQKFGRSTFSSFIRSFIGEDATLLGIADLIIILCIVIVVALVVFTILGIELSEPLTKLLAPLRTSVFGKAKDK